MPDDTSPGAARLPRRDIKLDGLVNPETGADAAINIDLLPGLSLVTVADDRLVAAVATALQSCVTGLTCYAERMSQAEPAATGRSWLAARARQHPGWDTDLASELIAAFDLEVHIDKPLYMYSRGSLHKLGHVGAFACGADVALLELPYAGLDAPSAQVLTELLYDAAEHPSRAWILIDYERPASLADAGLAAHITV